MSKAKILILEDDAIIAETLAMYIQDDEFELCAIVYDPHEAIERIKHNTPDACLLDIHLSADMDGVDVAKYIQQHHDIPFLFISSYADKATIERAKSVNPAGYIVKPFNKHTVLASLQVALSNFHLQKSKALKPLNYNEVNAKLLHKLSEREFEVLNFLYSGKSNLEIAEALYLSVNTVKTHIKNLYLKLDVNSRYDIIRKYTAS